MLNRRAFTAALAALAGGPARASEDRDGGRVPELIGRVRLDLGRTDLQPRRLILALDPVITISLNRDFPMSNERRAGLITPTLARRFRNGEPVGELRLSGRRLIAVPHVRFAPGEVFLVNGVTSWRINAGTLGKESTAPLPLLSDLPEIGRLFRGRPGSRDRDNLLILVTPSILDGEF